MWLIADKENQWLPLWECMESSGDVDIEVIGNIYENPELLED
jgi:uncharacterized phage protein (TIGR01671 family)